MNSNVKSVEEIMKNIDQILNKTDLTKKQAYYRERILETIAMLEKNLSVEERILWNNVLITYHHLFWCQKQHRFEYKKDYCLFK